MLTGELRSQVDKVWMSIYTGGISNPLAVIEQITYLLFLRRLDELQTLEENKSTRTGKPIERVIFPSGKDTKGCNYEDMRWSRLKNTAPAEMFTIVRDHVFPFLQSVGGVDSSYSKHMEKAQFLIPTPNLLSSVIDLLDQIPMQDRDTKGDLYEYMLGKLNTAGQNGQFRTPRHIIELMVGLTAPTVKDTICDPASGTCGFLIGASQYLLKNNPNILVNEKSRDHFNNTMFYGYDFDSTMLRIGSMNMLLHGVENPEINYRDSLSQDYEIDEEKFSLILANPPFKGSLDYDNTSKALLSIVDTRKTELLFMALFLKLLKPGGRAAVIVPDGVLFNGNDAYKKIRTTLINEQKLDAVISLPSGVFKPYAGVSTAILLFTKTNSGGTESVWFYDMTADGFSLNDNRQPLLDLDKLGFDPKIKLTEDDHLKNNLPDILLRWQQRDSKEKKNERTAQSFCVPRADIEANDYDLSLNRYKQVVHEHVDHTSPKVLIEELKQLESDIQHGLAELEELLK